MTQILRVPLDLIHVNVLTAEAGRRTVLYQRRSTFTMAFGRMFEKFRNTPLKLECRGNRAKAA